MIETARTKLAQAIATVSAAREAARADADARYRADALVATAEQALADARAREADAVKRNAGELVSSIRSGAPPPDSDVAAARREVADAQEKIAATKAVMPVLDDACRESEQRALDAEKHIARLADAVITEEAPLDQMLVDIEALQNELNAKRLAVRFLRFRDLVPSDHLSAVDRILLHQTLVGGYGGIDVADFSRHPVMLAWMAAREALKSNPEVSLPE